MCDGTYRGTGKNVTVPSGATCVLTAGTTVTHDVIVAAGGTLIDPTVNIRHDLLAQNPAGIVISGDSIGHDLRVEGLGGSATEAGNNICGTEVGHDLVVDGGLGSAGALLIGSCPNGGNSVGHDLVISDNVNAIVVDNNSVGHDLVVSGNADTVVGTGNSVGHELRVDDATTSHQPEQQQKPKPKPGPKPNAAPADRPPPAPRPHDD
jgi:hypothetical protein